MHNFKDLVARQSHLNNHHIQIPPERDDAQFQEVHIQFEDNKGIDRIEFTNIMLGQKYISITELKVWSELSSIRDPGDQKLLRIKIPKEED